MSSESNLKIDAVLSLGDFMGELDIWLRWLCEERISQAPGWLRFDERGLALGCSV